MAAEGLTEEQWEDLCDGCGHCCNLARTGVACPGLDCTTNRCTVYEKRTETEVCVKVRPGNVSDLFRRGILPLTCGYVRYQLMGIPYTEARLDDVPRAKLKPFVIAPPALQEDYVRQRKVWFMQLEDKPNAEEQT